MMKTLISIFLILILTVLPAMAAMDPYYPQEVATGLIITPRENLGAPWFGDDALLTFGDGKDATISYDDAMDKLYFNNTPLYLEEAVTFGAGMTATGKIAGVTAGTTSTDAANMAQLWTKVNKSGDTMTGSLAITGFDITGINDLTFDAAGSTIDFNARKLSDIGSPTTTGDAATIDLVWLRLNKSGDTMSGPLAMGSQKITGLAAGTTTGDAARINDVWSRVNKSGDTMTGDLIMSSGTDINMSGSAVIRGVDGTYTGTVEGEQLTSTDDARVDDTTTTNILHVNTTSTYAGKASYDVAIAIDPYEPTYDGIGMSDSNIRTPVFVGNASNNQTLTLPTAAAADGCSLKFIVKTDPGSYYFILAGQGSEKINGAATKMTTNQYDCLEVTSNGVAWYITSSVGTWT